MSNSDAKKIMDQEIETILLTNFVQNEGIQMISNYMTFIRNVTLYSDISLNVTKFLLRSIFFILVKELALCVKNILSGQYEDVIDNELLSNFIDAHSGNDFRKLICNGINEEIITHDSWLCMGIASLLYFVQCNCTGPQIDKDIKWLKIQEENALKHLSLHDECNTNVRKPELLYFSKIIFSNEILQNSYNSCTWWLFRANLLHQYILDESSGMIFEETDQLIKKINDVPLLENLYCKTLFYIEAAQFYLYYRRIQNSEKYIEFAQDSAKLNLRLEGALGKRTKYQLEDKAQLFLKIDRSGKESIPF